MTLNPAGTAIVTDSAADLPAEIIERHGIRVIPAVLVMDGREFPDGAGLSREAFYRQMATGTATTASPPPEVFSAAYRASLDEGARQVLSMHVSGRLSGIVSMAQRAAETFRGAVRVIDTGQVSLGAGFQVMAAASASADERSLADVLSAIDSVRRRIRVVAMIDDLEYLRRSGRVDWLRTRLGALLHIRVLVELTDGVVRRLGQVRSRARAIESLVGYAEAWGGLERLGVLHSAVAADARTLAERLAARVAQEPLVVDVTTVIGAHVGPRSLGLVGLQADAADRLPGRSR